MASPVSVSEIQHYYYDTLTDPSLKKFLHHPLGVVFARLPGHPYWPSRMCSLQEWCRMLKYREKEDQICVYFFGSNNYGWVSGPSSLLHFADISPTTNGKAAKQYSTKPYKQGMEEARVLVTRSNDPSDEELNKSPSFWERISCQKEVESGKSIYYCPACDDYMDSTSLTVCPGKVCGNQFHVKCLPKNLAEPCGMFCVQCRVRYDKIEDKASQSAPKRQKREATKNSRKSLENGFRNINDFDEVDCSEEKCLICLIGGELVLCDFPGCNKVYHERCLGTYPFPRDDSLKWCCPRHTCSISSLKEYEGTSNADFKITDVKLWKCIFCPVAVSNDFLNQTVYRQLRQAALAHATHFSTKKREIVCPNCASPTPLVSFSMQLERIWSMLATNRQGIPFFSPLLPGIRSTTRKPSIDLLQILIKIRRLEYSSTKKFMNDINQLVEDAKKIISGQSNTLEEAANTIQLLAVGHINSYESILNTLEKNIPRDERSKDKSIGETASPASKDSSWVVPWRQECMPFGRKSFLQIESKTLEEWENFVQNPEIKINIRSSSSLPIDSSISSCNIDGTPLNDSEQKDVIMILKSLHDGRMNQDDIPMKAHDYFLSPSTEAMKEMFELQGSMIRKLLMQHAVLKDAWNLSREALLHGPDDNVITLGEGLLAAEIQIANQNLRGRLKEKEKILGQITQDNIDLNGKLKYAHQCLHDKEKQLNALKEELAQYEEKMEENNVNKHSRNRRSKNFSPTKTVSSMDTV